MKIAVTAASGNLGSAIIQQLKTEVGNNNVIGLARTPEKAGYSDVEIKKGDYNNRKDLEKSLTGIDAVLLVSGMDHPDKRIEQHRNVIEAAKSCGVKKIVYTSIVGDPEKTAFSPIIKSNRQTEEDIKQSGLDWVIGRNGLYIEPDLEYIDNYMKAGTISNSAADGLCAYTSRDELAFAYSKMLQNDSLNRQIFNLVGEPITQTQLADAINKVFMTGLSYTPMNVDEYISERKNELGEFLGTVIGGIYEGIRNGAFNPPSGFEKAAGRPHKPTLQIISEYQKEST